MLHLVTRAPARQERQADDRRPAVRRKASASGKPWRSSWRPARILTKSLPLLFVLAGVSCAPLADIGFDPRPLNPEEPIGPSTRARLLSATQTPDMCTAWLAQAGVSFRPLADRIESDVCRVIGAGNLRDGIGRNDPTLSPAGPMMTCRLAAAVAVWRRQSVAPAAREILGADVRQIEHLGVYACRNVNSQAVGRPSAHARAEAIDIAAFRLSDGRRITVKNDWNGRSAEARFLRRIRDDACRIFGTTLSPDYNAAHADHLHLEGGPGGMCS